MKKKFTLILSLILIFSLNINVYATTTPVTDTLKSIGVVIEDFKQANQYTWTQISDFIDTMSKVVGLPKKGHSSGGHSFDPEIVHEIDPNVDPEDPDSVGTWIGNQINIQDNDDITVTNDFRTMMNDFNDSLSIAYLYSYTADDLASLFSTVDAYIEAKKFMGSDLLSNQYFFLCSYYGINKIYTVSKQTYPYLYINGTDNTINTSSNYAWGNLINGQNNTSISMDVYNWDANNKEWVSGGTGLITCYGLIDLNKQKAHETASNQRAFFMSNTSHIQIRFIKGTANVTDIIYQPYYYNNRVWTDFSSSTGDYTFSADNINTVSYGDITSYIDSYNTENGYPPSVQDIEVTINNKNDDSGGGGSGSGGDDSGDDDTTNIFGWLKQLGKVLGDLIKGLGEFFTEVVTGLVSAITDLLSGIADLISNITETLPSAFMDWFASLFEWMPAEWKALLSASLVFMVLWGIIKVIRG